MEPHEDKSARWFIYTSIAFFLITITIGLIMAIKFIAPEFLGGIPALGFGRIRAIHTNGVLFGWLLAADMGLCYYIVPRLAGVKLFSEKLGMWTLYLWIVILLGAVVTLGMGDTQGKEYLELNSFLDILVTIAWVMFGINIFGTIAKRKYENMYASLWYIMGTILWTAVLWIVANLPVYSGVNDANVNWWFGHNAVGLIFTPVGLAIAYYFIPKSTGNPLYSHKLSLIGFWTIAFLYIWTGAHHIIFGPIPTWLQTIAILFSISLLIPVWTAVTNFYGTLRGKWAQGNYVVKFFIAGTTFYLLTCFQGPMHSLRTVNQIVSKTDWIVGHAHMAVFGAFTFFALGGIYYALPKILKRSLYSEKMAEWHFWLSFVGFLGFAISLWIGGFVQGLQWMDYTISFLDTVKAMFPYYMVRMFSAILMVAAQVMFAFNIWRTVRGGENPQLKPALA
ncbi:MAG: cbb3-type cytochrome c oxidase subunit I [Bacteroidetes bacterium]|nr:cbb3-type cytochrome c oxidase subunit I [Bacteroidota bacterium]MCW5894664.1 cbb3-type cytochrome c oxidase subunit I [Bacteroidota bacterium]